MPEAIGILTVEKDDGDGLIATFSDGTTAGYVAEELLELRPKRELTKDSQKKVNYEGPAPSLRQSQSSRAQKQL